MSVACRFVYEPRVCLVPVEARTGVTDSCNPLFIAAVVLVWFCVLRLSCMPQPDLELTLRIRLTLNS